MFVAFGAAQAVGLGVEQGVEGVLHGGAHDLAEVLAHHGLIDVDDLAKGLGRRGRGASFRPSRLRCHWAWGLWVWVSG